MLKVTLLTTEINNITLFLQLTSGGSSVDMDKTLIVYSSPDIAPTELTNGTTADGTNFQITNKYNDNGNDILIDKGEKFEVHD